MTQSLKQNPTYFKPGAITTTFDSKKIHSGALFNFSISELMKLKSTVFTKAVGSSNELQKVNYHILTLI